MDRPAAPRAAAGGFALGIQLPLRRLVLFAAWRARGSPLDGRELAAANAEAGLAPLFLAPLALGPAAAPFRFDVRPSVLQPGSLAGLVARPVRRPALLETRLAGRAAGRRRELATPGANALGVTRGPLLARPLALVVAGADRIATRFSRRAQPRVAGLAGRVAFRRATGAEAPAGLGWNLAAARAQAGGPARGSAFAEPFAVGRAANRGISVCHRCSPFAVGIGAADARPLQGPPDVQGERRYPRWRRSQNMPRAIDPQTCMPPRVLSPVQMMISVQAGRSSFTAFRLAVTRFALRRPFPIAGCSPGQGRISPSASALNRWTTYRSSARPVPKKCTRNVFAVLLGIAIAAVMVSPPSRR